MERPPHTDHQAVREYLDDLFLKAKGIRDRHMPSRDCLEDSPLRRDLHFLATIVMATLDVFIDIWAHDRAAFQALGVRLETLSQTDTEKAKGKVRDP